MALPTFEDVINGVEEDDAPAVTAKKVKRGLPSFEDVVPAQEPAPGLIERAGGAVARAAGSVAGAVASAPKAIADAILPPTQAATVATADVGSEIPAVEGADAPAPPAKPKVAAVGTDPGGSVGDELHAVAPIEKEKKGDGAAASMPIQDDIATGRADFRRNYIERYGTPPPDVPEATPSEMVANAIAMDEYREAEHRRLLAEGRWKSGEKVTPLQASLISGLKANRKVGAFAGGAYATAQGMAAALPWFEQFVGIKTPVGALGKDFADRMEDFVSRISPEDPSFIEQLASGFGSMATFIIPGLGAEAMAANVAKVAPWLARVTGATVMSVMEASTEAGNVYQELVNNGMSEAQAASRANHVWWQNMILLAATNKAGVFSKGGGIPGKAAKSFVSEGVQEGAQGIISERQTLGAVDNDPYTAERLKQYGTEALIGGIVGGVVGGVKGGMDRAAEREAEQGRMKDLDRKTEAAAASGLPPFEDAVAGDPAPPDAPAEAPTAAAAATEEAPAPASAPDANALDPEPDAPIGSAAGSNLAALTPEQAAEEEAKARARLENPPSPLGGREEPAATEEQPVAAEEPPAATDEPTAATEEPVAAEEQPKAPAGPERTLKLLAGTKQVSVVFPDAAHKDLFRLGNGTPSTAQAELVAAQLGTDAAGVTALAARYRNDVRTGVRAIEAGGRYEAPRFDAAPAVTAPVTPKVQAPKAAGDEVAYRGYLIRKGFTDSTFFVQKGGFTIATTSTVEEARAAVDAVVGPVAKAPAAPTAPAAGTTTAGPKAAPADAPTQTTTGPKGFGETNKVFTKDAADAARERIKARLRGTTLTAGVDPTILKDMVELGGYYFEAGVRAFPEWAQKVIEDVGEDVRDYLRPTFDMIEARYAETETMDDEEVVDDGGTDTQQPGTGDRGPLETLPPPDVPADEEGGDAPGVGTDGAGADGGRAGDGEADGAAGQPGVGAGEGGVGVSPERDAGEGAGEDTGGDLATDPTAPTPGQRPTGPGVDYRITDEDRLGESTPKPRFRANVAAIKLVAQLEREARHATPEEQAILVQYVGWGGLKEVFDPRNAQNWHRGDWKKEWAELRALITDGTISQEEYEAMNASVLNAHYTSVPVVRAMWKAMERLGFKGGRVLEPGAGIGHFLGLMPNELAAGSKRTAVEIDTITGRILSRLYPNANVQIQPYQETRLADNFYDVAIGNVPFFEGRVLDTTVNGKKYQKLALNQSLHDYYFAKTLDKVRPGGVVAFITSKYTLDKQDAHVREYLATQAELLGAIRLPQTAFKQNAGTIVTTDIIFLKKRAAPIAREQAKQEAWVGTTDVRVQDYTLTVNAYVAAHPEMVMGKFGVDTRYGEPGAGGVAVEDDGRDLATGLEEAIGHLPENVIEAVTHAPTNQADPDTIAKMVDGRVKPGGYAVGKDGLVYLNRVMKGRDPELVYSGITGDQAKRIVGMLGIRDALNEVFKVQLQLGTDEVLRAAQKVLADRYDAFVKKWTTTKKGKEKGAKPVTTPGYLNTRENIQAIIGDPDGAKIRQLERWDPAAGTFVKADIFTQRTIKGPERVESEPDAQKALLIVLNESLTINWQRMAELTGKTPEEIQAELKGRVFRNPEGSWETAEEYLSGNVRAKLEAARGAAEADEAFAENVAALEAVQPKELEPKEIAASMGASWIPPEEISNFVGSILEIAPSRVAAGYAAPLNFWSVKVDGQGRFNSFTALSKWGTRRVNAVELINDALNLQMPTVYDSMPDGTRVLNPTETTAARTKLLEIKDRFAEWAWEDEKRAAKLAKKYNVEFNSIRLREYSGTHLALTGKAEAEHPRPHQLNAIWRILQGGNTLLAHIVGAGKTMVMIGASMEGKRLGIFKKPMIVVPNHMVPQFERDFLRMYPAANVLSVGEGDLGKARRQDFMARIATGNWDAVIVPHSSFTLLPVSVETYKKHIDEQIRELELAMMELAQDPANRRIVRQVQAAIERLKERLERKLKQHAKDQTMFFEELGVDQLFVDEAHYFKNLMFGTRMLRVRGLSSSASERASDLFMKTQYLTKLNNGRGVVFSTGTPISNTMAEMYTMLRYLAMPTLREHNWQHFDAWAGTFGKTVSAPEMTVDGKFRETTRFAKFVNMPELATIFREVADVQVDPEALGLARPTIRGGILAEDDAIAAQTPGLPLRHDGKVELVLSPMSDDQVAYMHALGERGEAVKGGLDPRVDNMLKIATDGRKNSLDGRLVNAGAAENPQSKANLAVLRIREIWERTAKDRLTQLVFLDMATPKAKTSSKAKSEPWQMTLAAFAKSRRETEANAKLRHAVEIISALMAGKPVSKDVLSPHVDSFTLDQEISADMRDAVRAIMAGKPNPIQPADDETGEEAVEETDDERQARESIYHEIKQKLIARGVPAEEIAFMHDAKNKGQKQAIFDGVNEGRIRILLGSTDKMGAGTNVQKRLYALHHLDAPWRPADIEQREGRILRQGNDNRQVEILQYVSEGQGGMISFDAFMWQNLEAKARFIRQAMKGDLTVREAEDVGFDFDPALVKALATGNPLILERENTNNEIRLLESAKRAHSNNTIANRQRLTLMKNAVAAQTKHIEGIEADIATLAEHPADPFTVTVMGEVFTDKAAADAKIKARFAEIEKDAKFRANATFDIGEYRGFKLQVATSENGAAWMILRGQGEPRIMGTPSIASADGVLRNLDHARTGARATLQQTEREVAGLQSEIEKPFPKEERYRNLVLRLAAIEEELGIKKPGAGPVFTPPPPDPVDDDDSSPDEDVQRFVTKALRRFRQPSGGATTVQAAPGVERKDRIINALNDAMRRMRAGGLVLQGGFRGPRGLLGLRHKLSGNIRMRRITDIDTYAHEAGHGLQRALGFDLARLRPFKAEMKALTQLQGVKGPKLSEGFAEFVRVYATDPALARTAAPRFYPVFEQALGTVPELEAALHEYRAEVARLRSAQPAERMEGGMIFSEDRPSTLDKIRAVGRDDVTAYFKKAMRTLRFEYADKFLPLREVEMLLNNGKLFFGGLSFYKKARTMTAKAVRVGQAFVAEGIVDYHTNRVIAGTKGLRAILDPIWDRRREFQKYEIARRIQELEESSVRAGVTGPTQQKHAGAAEHLRVLFELRRTPQGDPVADVVRDYDAQHPDFDVALRELQAWNDGLLEYMVDSGNYSQEAIDGIRWANQIYVPLHRLMEDEATPPKVKTEGTGSSVVNVKRTAKALGGKSERMVLAPIEERYKQAFTMVAAALRNDVAASMAKALDPKTNPAFKDLEEARLNLGTIMDKVAKPIQATTFPLERIKDALLAAGATHAMLNHLNLAQLATVFTPAIHKLGRNEVVIWRDGVAEVWQIHDPFMLRALTQVDKQAVANFLRGAAAAHRVLAGLAGILRRTVVMHPNFLVANVARDQQEGLMQAKGILPPYLRGVQDALGGGHVKLSYEMGGGQIFGLARMDPDGVTRGMKDLMDGRWRQGNRVRAGLELAEAFTELFEMPTRIGVAKTANDQLTPAQRMTLTQGDIDTEIAFVGRESTVDFGMSGASPAFQAMAAITAFLRPMVNGIYKFSRFTTEAFKDPTGWQMRRLATVGGLMILVEMLLYANNKDDERWRDIPDVDKTMYWIYIHNPLSKEEWKALSPKQRLAAMDHVWKIPRGYMFGTIFGTLPRSVVEALDRKDATYLSRTARQLGGFGLAEAIPTGIKGGVEVAIGRDLFFDKPIVPERIKDRPARFQETAYTSEPAKMIGRETGLSPIVVDHLIRSYLGTVGTDVAAGATAVRDMVMQDKPPAPALNLSDYPVARRFIQRYPSSRSQPIEDFYELHTSARGALATLRDAQKAGDTAKAADVQRRLGFEIEQAGRLARDAEAFSATRRELEAMRAHKYVPSRPKRDKIDEITLRELDRARAIMDDIKRARAAYDARRATGAPIR